MINMEKKIIYILKNSKNPLKRSDIRKKALGYNKDAKRFNLVFNNLLEKGAIKESKGRYALTRSRKNLIEGEVVKVVKTFGFVKPNEEGVGDIFIPGRYLMGAMVGDKVVVEKSRNQQGDLAEGQVVKITEKGNSVLTGELITIGKNIFFVPDILPNQELAVEKDSANGIPSQSKVLAEIVKRGERHSEHVVRVVQAFGSVEEASASAEAILAEHHLTPDFPEEVMEQAQAIAVGVGIHPKEIAQRADLRDWNIFTIDGPDTKDIDDAISLTPTANGWELGVHIADVSYYVTRQSPLDKEAYNRGNSVYFVNRVIPMLPKELSNGICSLNPQEDRLAFSAIIQLDNAGNMQSYEFIKTVINSRLQGVYGEINEILDDTADDEISNKYADQTEVIKNMEILAKTLNEKRSQRGSVNLDSTESKILIGENGEITDIVPRESGVSENMIEEFMLIANEAAAKFAEEKELPFIYRVHEEPSPDRVEKLFTLLDKLGISYKRPQAGESYKETFNQVLKQVEGKPIATVINYSILRVMAKAKYSPDNLGHFGLSLKNYAHFTSPIRRYSDLSIHRILTGFLTGMRHDNLEKFFRDWVADSAQQTSKQEVVAMTVERNIEDCYKAQYMKGFIGEQFKGVVSSVTGFGIYVELPNTVEGLMRASEMPGGDWIFDEVVSYSSATNGKILAVGDSVTIEVTGAEVASGNVDFKLVL